MNSCGYQPSLFGECRVSLTEIVNLKVSMLTVLNENNVYEFEKIYVTANLH